MAGSIIDNATDHALGTARLLAGRLISYTRGADTIRFRAIVGNTTVEVIDQGVVVDQAEARTYLFPRVELAKLSPDVPQASDYVEEQDDDETVTECRYTAMPATGGDCWRFADRDRKWIRLFSKQVPGT